MGELMLGLTEYFAFTNGERQHQSLGHKTPDVVYRTALGGGAVIVGALSRSRVRLNGSPLREGLGRGSKHPAPTRLLPKGRGFNREVSF